MYNWVFLIWWPAIFLTLTRWVFLEISSACSNTNPPVDPCAMWHPGLNQGTHSTVNCKARRYNEGFPLWKGVWTPPKPPVVLDELILESSLGMLWLIVRGECSCISVCFAIFMILNHRRHHHRPDERLNSCLKPPTSFSQNNFWVPPSTGMVGWPMTQTMRMLSHHMHCLKCVKTNALKTNKSLRHASFTFIEFLNYFVLKWFFSIHTCLNIAKHINGGIHHVRNISHHFTTCSSKWKSTLGVTSRHVGCLENMVAMWCSLGLHGPPLMLQLGYWRQ